MVTRGLRDPRPLAQSDEFASPAALRASRLANSSCEWAAHLSAVAGSPSPLQNRILAAAKQRFSTAVDSAHQVLMVQRFDRAGDPFKPTRKLYASAHTALRLRLDAVRGDPERSYLGLADRLRVWTNDGAKDQRERLGGQLAELWSRMAFNALVGNTDDHALNTGLLFDRVGEGQDRMAWGLSPAFDITPNMVGLPQKIEEGPSLSLATGTDGRSGTSVARLAEAAARMGLDRGDAIQWLTDTAKQVASQWEPLLRAAAGPIIEDSARMHRLVEDVRPSFAYAEWLALAPSAVA
jgi:serine/threonine-protein kinase HipA